MFMNGVFSLCPYVVKGEPFGVLSIRTLTNPTHEGSTPVT